MRRCIQPIIQMRTILIMYTPSNTMTNYTFFIHMRPSVIWNVRQFIIYNINISPVWTKELWKYIPYWYWWLLYWGCEKLSRLDIPTSQRWEQPILQQRYLQWRSICNVRTRFNRYDAEIFVYNPWRLVAFLIWNHHKCLGWLFPIHLIPMLWVFGHYK